MKHRFYLFARDGFPPYGTTIVATQKMVKEKPDVAVRFIIVNPSNPNRPLLKEAFPEADVMTDDELSEALISAFRNQTPTPSP